MRQSDIHILEHLRNDGRELIDSPRDIAENVDFALSTVRERMPVLRRAGLIHHHDEAVGQYKIAELGRRYLAGQLSEREKAEIERELLQQG